MLNRMLTARNNADLDLEEVSCSTSSTFVFGFFLGQCLNWAILYDYPKGSLLRSYLNQFGPNQKQKSKSLDKKLDTSPVAINTPPMWRHSLSLVFQILRNQLNKNSNKGTSPKLAANTSPAAATPMDLSVPTQSLLLPAAAAAAAVTNSTTPPNPNYKRPRQIFTLSQEEQLAVYVRDTATYYSGLSSKEVRILAFVYGVCNSVDMPSGWRETHQASFDWCLGFIKRNKLSPMILASHAYKSLNNSILPTVAPVAAQPIPELPKASAVIAANGVAAIDNGTHNNVDK